MGELQQCNELVGALHRMPDFLGAIYRLFLRGRLTASNFGIPAQGCR